MKKLTLLAVSLLLLLSCQDSEQEKLRHKLNKKSQKYQVLIKQLMTFDRTRNFLYKEWNNSTLSGKRQKELSDSVAKVTVLYDATLAEMDSIDVFITSHTSINYTLKK